MVDFRKFFSRTAEHPLGTDEQVTTLLTTLPAEDPAAALQDLTHWLMLVASEDKLRHRAAKLLRLDQAALPFERKLREQYVSAARLHKLMEARIWNSAFEALDASVSAHLRCIGEALQQDKASSELAALAVRAVRRLELAAHWFQLRYQPLPETLWEQVYTLIKLAEQQALMREPVTLNATTGTQTTFVTELLKLLMLAVAEPARLTRPQIALARHIAHAVAGHFVWEDIPGNNLVFQVDFSRRAAPTRLTQTSEQHFMARCFGAGGAVAELVSALKRVEQGTLPAHLGLSDAGPYRRADLLEVLAYLSQQWSRAKPVAPHQHFDKRQHPRVPFFMHICVTHGFEALHASLKRGAGPATPEPRPLADTLTYEGQVDTQLFGFVTERTRAQQRRIESLALLGEDPVAQNCETWVVQDMSEGGFGIEITTTPEDWVTRDSVVGVNFGAGEWQLGIIRRCDRAAVGSADVGIEVLSRRPQAVTLRPLDSQLSVWETAADTQTYHHTPALLLPEETPLHAEPYLLLAPGSYQMHKLYELATPDGKRVIKLVDRLATLGTIDQLAFADLAPK